MEDSRILEYIQDVLKNMPSDWINLTTHRLDVYEEKLAKVQFLEAFEKLFKLQKAEPQDLKTLPSAFDYIRLGHPLSCVLEWVVARFNDIESDHVISFSSKTTPILSILRENLLADKNTQILYTDKMPALFDAKVLREIYGYKFDIKHINEVSPTQAFEGTTVVLSQQNEICSFYLSKGADIYINIHDQIGSILVVNGNQNKHYIPKIQHVRRRETIAMTPANVFAVLKSLVEQSPIETDSNHLELHKNQVLSSIKEITKTTTDALVASSGLSIQYAILMGLIDHAFENHPGKNIKIIVPPNCYGGTNDQARRVAACIDHVQVCDLHVDGGKNMVESLDLILDEIALEDAVPYIIAEIPTNPRVEVPDLDKLKDVLSIQRKTSNNQTAVDPVFILDQTFCPNVPFLGDGEILSSLKALSYASGSKFPSGGLCTSGYCVANEQAASLMKKIEKHLILCDNEATNLQYEILAKQMPSMVRRIEDAYQNTREFVAYIADTLPEAKINFVSEALAAQGFTPSVFSLDLPTQGNTNEEKEAYKRTLNHQLIHLMINDIPNESKHCVSYGQLKGCYWTIPATSTQGTTKEGDKDYIVRVALSPKLDLDLHKKTFSKFVGEMKMNEYV